MAETNIAVNFRNVLDRPICEMDGDMVWVLMDIIPLWDWC